MGVCGFKPSTLDQARGARILVAITVHFNAARLEYLAEVMRALAEFPVADMHVILVTNTVDATELALLQRLCDELLPGKNASIRSYEYLAHPHYLTWSHRQIVATEFADGNQGRYTHFVYLEDDMRLSFTNFCYFVEFRESLRDAGLLPSFVRVEYSRDLNGFVSTDNATPVDVSRQARIDTGDIVLANLPFPYTACYILDTALAAEFMQTRSFKRERSRSVSDMDVRERAAMGLCFENVPQAFECRYVVPIAKATGMALSFAWLSHLPNNYANDPATGFGKIRMDSLFLNANTAPPRGRDPAAATAVRTETSSSTAWQRRKRWRNPDAYMVLPNKVIEGLRWRLGIKR